jgi:hypothetical protein
MKLVMSGLANFHHTTQPRYQPCQAMTSSTNTASTRRLQRQTAFHAPRN